VVVAAVGSGASPSGAESVTTRGSETVAREAPGSGQAGIAVLRGTDRVQLLGERDGWSEILLPDKRRAWVPSSDITRVKDVPQPADDPVGTATPTPAETTSAETSSDRALAAEIARLRGTVDELAAWRASLPDPGDEPFDRTGEVPWVVGGAGFALGLLIGGAWERHRSRRDRSLRF
jgi:hypothetical protein